MTDTDLSRPLEAIMQSPLVWVSPSATVAEALETARARGVHHLPVRDASGLVGFTCVCDLLSLRPDLPLSRAMRTSVQTLSQDASSLDAARLMHESGAGSVLVVDGDEPCGIVTRGDVTAWDGGADEVLSEERCDCCGLREHLRKLEGRFLCAFCLDGSTEAEWFREHAPPR